MLYLARIKRSRSLAAQDPLNSVLCPGKLKEYCLCLDVAKQNDDIANFTNVHCNLTEPMVQCKNTRTPLAKSLFQECHRNRRMNSKMYCIYAFYDLYCSLHTDNVISFKTIYSGHLSSSPLCIYVL
jgi:hypothetical protein